MTGDNQRALLMLLDSVSERIVKARAEGRSILVLEALTEVRAAIVDALDKLQEG